MLNLDLLADLPAPHDDEPPSLRSDIIDELADHLHCAFRREVLKDGDEAAAEQRVLNRFGDPKKLARRLWWQAMWSRIMGQRILSGLQWLLTFTAVILAAAVFRQQSTLLEELKIARQEQRAEQQALTTTLNRLLPAEPAAEKGTIEVGTAELSSADRPGFGFGTVLPPDPTSGEGSVTALPSGPGTVFVLLSQPPEHQNDLSKAQVRLIGQETRFADPPEPVKAKDGRKIGALFQFLKLPIDRYTLEIKLPDGQQHQQRLVIRDSAPSRIELDCPPTREKAPVLITVPPVPDDLRQAGYRFVLECQTAPIVVADMMSWQPSRRPVIRALFDPATGRLASISESDAAVDADNQGSVADLGDAPDDERVIFALTGPAKLTYRLASATLPRPARPGAGFGAAAGAAPPGAAAPAPDKLWETTRDVQRGENRWDLDLPDEVVAAARKELATAKTAAVPMGWGGRAGSRRPALERYAAEQDAARTEPLGERSRLILKLTTETEDGPAPDKVQILFTDDAGNQVALPQTAGDRSLSLDADGECVIGPFEAGRYLLQLQFPDGRFLREKLALFRPGQERTEHVVCPPPLKKSAVLIQGPPVPDDLRKYHVGFYAVLVRQPFTVAGRSWRLVDIVNNKPVAQLHIELDPETGLAAKVNSADLSRDKPEDRLVLIPAGEFRAEFFVSEKVVLPIGFEDRQLSHRPERSGAVDSPDELIFRADPGDTVWKLDVPDEMWAEARQKLMKENPVLAPGEPPGESAEAERESPPGDSPGAKTPTKDDRDADNAAAEPLGDKCRLIVKLTSETKDGPAPDGAQVFLLDERGNEIPVHRKGNEVTRAQSKPDAEGRCVIGPFEPGRYKFVVNFRDGRQVEEKLPFFRPGQERTEHVVCPPPVTKTAVMITAPPAPKDLLRPGVEFFVHLGLMNQDFEGRKWTNEIGTSTSTGFDLETGLLIWVNDLNQRDVAPEERLVILPTGPYKFYVQLLRRDHPGKRADAVVLAEYRFRGGKPDFLASPGENKWEIRVDDEFWTAARKKLAEVSATGKPPGGDEPPGDKPPGDSPGAKTPVKDDSDVDADTAEPLGDRCRLVAKLTTETTDGPAATGLVVRLYNEHDVPLIRTVDKGRLRFRPASQAVQHLAQPDEHISHKTDEQGLIRFDHLEPGRYTIELLQPGGYTLKQRLPVLRPGQSFAAQIPCPSPAAKTSVLVTAPPVPEDLRRAGVTYSAQLQLKDRELERWKWKARANAGASVQFDPETGHARRANDVDLESDAPGERFLFLPAGPYAVSFQLDKRIKDGKNAAFLLLAVWPPKSNPADAPEYAAATGDNNWAVKVPDDFWAAARKSLAEISATGAPPADNPPAVPESTPGDSSGDKTTLP